MSEVFINQEGITLPVIATVTISVEEYKELLTARTRLNILCAWSESGERFRQEDVEHICGTYRKVGADNDLV